MGQLFEFTGQDVVQRGDGIETVRLSDPPLPGQSFVMGITSFPPGTGLERHSHNTIEQVTVLEGSGFVEIDGVEHRLSQYDCTQVPADEPHRFENDGDSLMRILWVYGSTEVTRTFTATGETVSNHGTPTAS
jgi:quercetin dioxygenase-like cupin family protein